ncbi:MAG: glycosyltransferase N-terminal domain-containing protein, partial [Bacteroidota bacterium]
MSAFIYSLGLWFYKLLISLVAWVNPKAELFIRGRKNVWQSLEDQVAVNTSPLLWVHCSSVGEYEQGRPVMEAFKNEFSDFKILVTFYSPSGYEAVSTDAIVNFKTYLPFDSKTNANRFLDLVKPEIAIFIKYEFWYFFLKELYRRDLPVYSVSSIFRPSQLFFKFYGGFYRNILKNISYFFVQDKNSSDLLNSLNLPNLVSGDTRIDRVLDIRNNNKSLPVIEMFVGDEVVMVIGSMRKEDLDIVIQFVIQHRDLKFIIAPHEIIDSMIMPLEERLNSTVRYSEFKNTDLAQQVLIIDNIGMLSTLYRYAHYT